MKELLCKKYDSGTSQRVVTLSENCSAVVQHNLTTKIKDPRTFIIPYKVGLNKEEKALYNSRSRILLMPLTPFKKLGIETLKTTPMTLQFTDHTIKRPLGIDENVIV